MIIVMTIRTTCKSSNPATNSCNIFHRTNSHYCAILSPAWHPSSANTWRPFGCNTSQDNNRWCIKQWEPTNTKCYDPCCCRPDEFATNQSSFKSFRRNKPSTNAIIAETVVTKETNSTTRNRYRTRSKGFASSAHCVFWGKSGFWRHWPKNWFATVSYSPTNTTNRKIWSSC